MILSDFLSRQKNNDSNLPEIIPISFKMCQVLMTIVTMKIFNSKKIAN